MSFIGLCNLPTYFLSSGTALSLQTESIAARLPSRLEANDKSRTITLRRIRDFSRNILILCLALHLEATGLWQK